MHHYPEVRQGGYDPQTSSSYPQPQTTAMLAPNVTESAAPKCGQDPPALQVLNDGHARIAKALLMLWQATAPIRRPEPAVAGLRPPKDGPPTLRDYAQGAHSLAGELEALVASLDI